MTIPSLGHLDGNSGGDLKGGTRLELPLWLGEMLAVSQRLGTAPLVTLDIPGALSSRAINALRANPRTVDIRALAPHFYSFAARLFELFDEDEMVEIMGETFQQRLVEIADHAHNSKGMLSEGIEFLRGLDETERRVFRSAHESSKAVRLWINNLKK